jgi:hypothetical protein
VNAMIFAGVVWYLMHFKQCTSLANDCYISLVICL